MAGEKFGLAVSVLIVAFVGINIIVMFGSLYGFNVKDLAGFTGASTTMCQNDVGGIVCKGVFYPMRPFKELCTEGTTKTCTNPCEIERAMAIDDRVCPTYCTDYCLSTDVANLLKK